MRPTLLLPALSAAWLLSGCATYSPLPLSERSDLAGSLPSGGIEPLDMNAVATLAVLNSPDLRAARAALHVAQAQAFAAGLLPDPQFSYTTDRPTDHVTSPLDPRFPEYNAYGLGLTADLQALLTYPSKRTATDAAYRQAQMQLLWEEWQTVAEARTLYVQQSIATARRTALEAAAQIYALAASESQRALAAGNLTLEESGADLALLNDVREQLGTAQRSQLQAQQELHAVLGVEPDVALPLRPLPCVAIPDRPAVQAAIARVASTRPDLQALQAGYEGQEANVRAAVLSQFPDISVGLTRARDVSDVHTSGVGVTLTLPLFDRGRGNIATQRATREQLRAEYQARIDQTITDAWHLWNETRQLDAQLRNLDGQLPRLRTSADSARAAYEKKEFPAVSYLALVGSYLSAQSTRLDLLQSYWTDSIALATVLGTQVQPAGEAPGTAATGHSMSTNKMNTNQ